MLIVILLFDPITAGGQDVRNCSGGVSNAVLFAPVDGAVTPEPVGLFHTR